MGLLSLLKGSRPAPPQVLALSVDLGTFKCGETILGSRPSFVEPYAKSFDRNNVAYFAGIELGTEREALNYAFITLRDFKGTFSKNGSLLPLSTHTTPEEIISQFGAPYWTDTMDEEMILFYEFQNGRIELQFEFPDRRQLEFITLMQDGILSKPDQREAYKLTREWPPK
jgi:hypothetical protein